MNGTELKSPVPRTTELLFSEFKYPVVRKTKLSIPQSTINRPFVDVLHSRRSKRAFGKISSNRLAELLWYSSRTLDCKIVANGYLWQHRPAPSGGGRHPIDLLVVRPSSKRRPLTLDLYEPMEHRLCRLDVPIHHAHALITAVREVLDIGEGLVLMFAAQFAKTLAKYVNGESLVWRDAGALLAVVSLVAESMDLNCCALGITGEPYISALLNSGSHAIGVGGLLVGEPLH